MPENMQSKHSAKYLQLSSWSSMQHLSARCCKWSGQLLFEFEFEDRLLVAMVMQ